MNWQLHALRKGACKKMTAGYGGQFEVSNWSKNNKQHELRREEDRVWLLYMVLIAQVRDFSHVSGAISCSLSCGTRRILYPIACTLLFELHMYLPICVQFCLAVVFL